MRKVLGLLLVLGVLGLVGTVQAGGPPDADGNLIVNSDCDPGTCYGNTDTKIVNTDCTSDVLRGGCSANQGKIIVRGYVRGEGKPVRAGTAR